MKSICAFLLSCCLGWSLHGSSPSSITSFRDMEKIANAEVSLGSELQSIEYVQPGTVIDPKIGEQLKDLITVGHNDSCVWTYFNYDGYKQLLRLSSDTMLKAFRRGPQNLAYCLFLHVSFVNGSKKVLTFPKLYGGVLLLDTENIQGFYVDPDSDLGDGRSILLPSN